MKHNNQTAAASRDTNATSSGIYCHRRLSLVRGFLALFLGTPLAVQPQARSYPRRQEPFFGSIIEHFDFPRFR